MALHIHVPKPLHGWKAFFNEIAVIVIGVLIALGLEAVVEELHWRKKAMEGEERLKVEMSNVFGYAAEQVIVTPCILAQLDQLRAHVASGDPRAATLPFDDFPNNLAVVRLPTRPWANTTWEALQQDGTITHFPVERQRYIGSMYSAVETMQRLVAQSGDFAGQALVAGYPQPLTEQMRSTLALAIGEQYRRTQYMNRLALQSMGTMRDLGYAPTDAALAEFLAKSNVSSFTIGFCKARQLPMADWKKELKSMPSLSKRPV